ncbi:MAG: hypothetical protein D6744_17130 [Planctomycetota bacterium]|nr:MAG: hypothetical protein D6744_17130 [Planctomycetota bacterium]
MKMRNTLAIVVAAAIASSAWAQCSGGKASAKQSKCNKGANATAVASKGACAGKSSDGSNCAAKCGDKAKTCDVAKAKSRNIPIIKYRIGDKLTCCPEEAAKLAGDKKDALQYVVGDKIFSNEGEAKEAYAKLLERQLQDITTIKYAVGDECVTCPMTAESMAKKAGKSVHYRVASFDFETREAALKAAEIAKKAAEQVSLKTVVGDKEYRCATAAAETAKAEGKKVEYCVGDKKTCCQVTASVDLALAKLSAALDALAKAANS